MPVPTLSPGDILQVIHAYSVDSQTCLNVFHYQVETAGTRPGATYFTELEEIAVILADDADTIVQGWAKMASAVNFSLWVQVQRIKPSRNPYVRVNTGDAGQVAGVSAPAICALSITRRTAAIGRGRSGHTQLSGLPADELNFGNWTNAQVTAADVYGDTLQNTLTYGLTGQIVPGIYSEDFFPTFERLVQTVAKKECRTMHRRTVGLGI